MGDFTDFAEKFSGYCKLLAKVSSMRTLGKIPFHENKGFEQLGPGR